MGVATFRGSRARRAAAALAVEVTAPGVGSTVEAVTSAPPPVVAAPAATATQAQQQGQRQGGGQQHQRR